MFRCSMNRSFKRDVFAVSAGHNNGIQHVLNGLRSYFRGHAFY